MDIEPNTTEYGNESTYCPEDNKLRLYVGRVPREEYDTLKADGWQSTAKQDCDFSATWTPKRHATALKYGGGIIGDEDTSPQDRAADRAERFSGYRDKRTGEALGHADRYDDGPAFHGFQNQARAERSAARHDRQAGHALDSWGKAEYWTRRTAGVISNALYKSSPAVRMGRIKTIEADLRRNNASWEEYAQEWKAWQRVPSCETAEGQKEIALRISGTTRSGYDYAHPRTGKETSIYSMLEPYREDEEPITGMEAYTLWMTKHSDPETLSRPWKDHYEMRLAYENQMLEAQGGRAAMVEMEPGGFIGEMQIRKVNRSPVTKRVVSVEVMGKFRKIENGQEVMKNVPVIYNIERLPSDAYCAPDPEEKEAFLAAMKEEKAAAKKPAAPSLVNPSLDEAQRLQAMLNEKYVAEWTRVRGTPTESYKPEVKSAVSMTQAQYSAISGGTYARAETREFCGNGQEVNPNNRAWSAEIKERVKARGPVLCKIRVTGYSPCRVIHISDKPTKPLPAAIWEKVTAETQETALA